MNGTAEAEGYGHHGVRILLALTSDLATHHSTYALAATDGTITVGQTGPLHLGRRYPVDLRPVLAKIPAADGPVEIVLVAAREDDEADALAESVAFEYCVAGKIRVVGVVEVGRDQVLQAVGLTDTTASGGPDGALLVDRINTLCDGALRVDQAAEAWAVGMLVAGVGKAPVTTPLLRLLSYPPSRHPAPGTSPRAAMQEHTKVERSQPQRLADEAPTQEGDPRHRTSVETPDILTVDDLAAALKISRSAAYRLAPLVPGSRIPGVGLRFRREDVEAFVQASRRCPGGHPGRRPSRSRVGMRVAPVVQDDNVEVMPGVTRRQLKERAGF